MSTPASDRTDYLICAVLVVVTLALYWQVQEFDFTHFDDNLYVVDNPHVSSGLTWSGIVWAFTHTHANNWHPLTWISHMTDCEIGELDPAWHHVTSAVFHTANAVLLFVLLSRLTSRRWPSAFAAAMFAVHPAHVESAAWVAERKDVLSTFFWFLTTLAYVHYVRSPNIRRYALVAALFALGLLSKPMLVTLPLVLLLLDYWPLGRSRDSFAPGRSSLTIRSVLSTLPEKLPLLVLAAASAITTFVVQRVTGAVGSLDAYPLGERIANAIVAYVAYIKMMFVPVNLACLYPHPRNTLPFWQVGGSAALLAVLTWLVIRASRSRPYLLVGWFWYLITLVPVIGLVQVGRQAMADRYTYVPFIGLFIIIAWGVPDALSAWFQRGKASAKAGAIIAGLLGVCAVAALGPVTYRQIGYWRNDITLWNRALAVTRNNAVAHYNLGTTLATLGDIDGAQQHFTEAVRIDPNKYDAHNNLGGILLHKGEIDKALVHLRKAVRLKPDYADAQCNLGTALLRRGDYRRAIPHFRACLKLTPDDEDALSGLQEAEELSRVAGNVEVKEAD